jgi:alpha-beta hydrolase superfamily lysophospholipase
LIDDIATLLDQTRAAWPGLPVVLGGISWGGKIVMALAARHPRSVDALALVCPGLRPRVGVTRRERLGVIAALLTGRKHARRFPIPLADPALFTANPDAQAFLRQDPLSLRTGTAGLLATSFFLDRRVRRAPRRVPHPVLLMLAGQDRIVDNDQTLAYFDQIASLSRTLITYPVAHHTLDFEPEPEPAHYVNDLVAWLDQLHLPQRPAPAPAGQGSAARHE